MAIIKVKTSGITADAVTDALIADDVVGTEHLTANEVDTAALKADAVTGAQLADDAVNSEHYTDGSVDTAHIADANITKAKLADSIDIFAGTSLTAADLGSGIHIKTADSGASVSADGDELVLENGGSGATAGMTFLSATDGYGSINFGDSGDNNIGVIDYDHPNNKMRFSTAGAERMNIDTNGFLNIGNPSVTGQFQAKGGGFIIAGETTAGANSSFVYSSKRSSNGGQFRFTQSSTVCGDITTNGSAVTYGSNSDYRLKENVDYEFDATTRLKQLKPARFNWIADETNTLLDGFIAHEVQSVVPEAITGTHNQVQVWRDNEELPNGVSVGDNKLDDDGNTIPDYQGIDQAKLVPLLVKTIQELEARITTLENA